MLTGQGKFGALTIIVLITVIDLAVFYHFHLQSRGYRTLTNADFFQTPDSFLPNQYFEEDITPFSSDGIEVKWFSKEGFPVTARIDFQRKTLFYYGAYADPSCSDQSPLIPMSDTHIKLIKTFLVRLPPTETKSFWNRDDYRKEYHAAFYEGGKLQKFHYPKNNLPSEFMEFLKFLHLENFDQ